MPYEVVFSQEDQTHLQDLEQYLAERFHLANAERYIQRLTSACFSLAVAPHCGTRRDDLAPGIRVIGFERRVAIYFKDRVFGLGIFYGGRRFSPAT